MGHAKDLELPKQSWKKTKTKTKLEHSIWYQALL